MLLFKMGWIALTLLPKTRIGSGQKALLNFNLRFLVYLNLNMRGSKIFGLLYRCPLEILAGELPY